MQNCKTLTRHAIERMSLRDLSQSDLEYVLDHGRSHIAAGVKHVFLGKRDIPTADKSDPRVTRLEGTTILLDSKNCDVLITVYRNRKAFKAIRRKAKYNYKKESNSQLPLAA